MSDIKTIARLAGCSIATVSRCFNSPELVRPATHARVMDIAQQQKYRPSIIGQQLRGKRTGLVGVMLPSLANPIFADCIGGIEEVLNQCNKRVLLTTTQYDASKEQQLVNILLHQRVDGLLLTVANMQDSRALATLNAAKIPYVLMYNHAPGHNTVSVDDRTAAYDAVRHLIGAGHRRIAMLAGYTTASDRSALRHQGYLDAMHEAGLAPMPLAQAGFDAQSIDTQLQYWLGIVTPWPTAIFCSTDILALAAIKSLRERGLGVPGDLSVMGFDGLEYGQYMEPTLATIRQPNSEIGRRASQRLLAQLDGSPQDTEPLFLAHTVLGGRSVGPPQAADYHSILGSNSTLEGANS